MLFTTFIGMFSVPVGAADSAVAVSRPAPTKAVVLHVKQARGPTGPFHTSFIIRLFV